MTALRELLDLPESVTKSAFVVQLSEGVRKPASVLEDYAVTPDLVRSFDQGLALVKAALDGHKSAAAYVHGSFGSGKSHFMSVLSLMLSSDPEHQRLVWREDALHALREKHGWLRDKKLLRLHFHMVGATSIDAKVFSEYLARTREAHPDAVLPAIFEDQRLFEDARDLRAQLGDEAFFSKMNEGRAEKKGWGSRASQGAWSAESFDRAAASAATDERQRLFDALARTHFKAFAGSTHGFVDFDRGLGELSRHAKRLGYDGVAFFFDELVLWLASGATDRAWLNREIGKLAKMVEAQDAHRDVALVSFVARQRDIAELVGDQLAGGDVQVLRDTLRFWEGRFGTITLPDRNLPAIVRKRVVRPKSPEAGARLEAAFAEMRRKLGTTAWQTLLGEIAEGEDAFRAVYPFSPALVEVLVAMSATLQRERTALKVLMEILVEHMDDFELGKLVAVGDLFDALAGGEEPMDGVLRERFQSVRRLYQLELLPLIQEQNKTNAREKCQRLRDTHPPQIGCSNCAESRCRTDNRLVKTLLLAALVPNSSVLKNMTVSRLVVLNHGTLKSVIPGNEGALAVSRLRELAAQVGKLRLGEQKDPSVHVVIEGVDLKPILESARQHDQPGARKIKLRSLLFTAFGYPNSAQPDFDARTEWRGTSRTGSVFFGNVRDMAEDLFRVKPEQDFRIIVDYPFDEPGHTPQEDESRVHALREKLDERTVVWLPDFFSDAVQSDLGMLVVLDSILSGEAWKGYLQHLRADDQQRARQDLESLRSQKQNRVMRAIESAYNVTTAGADQLDPSRKVAEHFHVLLPERRIPNLAVTRLSDAVDSLAGALLSECFPRHPVFTSKPTKTQLRASYKVFQRLCESDGRRATLDKPDRKDAEACSALNLVALTEANAVVRDEPFAEIERDLRASGVDTARPIAVEHVRRVLDPRRVRGLTREVQDFLVLTYALYTGREPHRGDRVLDDPEPGALSDEVELVSPKLPSADVWERALHRAGALFGIGRGASALRAKNVRRLADELERARAKAMEEGTPTLPSLLAARSRLLEPAAARAKTAAEALRLVRAVDARDGLARIEALAAFESSVTETALSKCLATARAVSAALSDTLLWQSVESLMSREDGAARALVEHASRVLSADEQTLSLPREVSRIRDEVGGMIAAVATTAVVGPVRAPLAAKPALDGAATTAGASSAHTTKVLEGQARSLADARRALDELRSTLDALEANGASILSFAWSLESR